MSAATVIVPTVLGGPRLVKLLESLGDQLDGVEVLVVDNGSPGTAMEGVRTTFPEVGVIRLERNAGYSRAVNLGAREAAGKALVLVNDDCVCDPGFLRAILLPLDPAAGVTMVAGVMREARDSSRIDTAGMVIGPTLLAFDYLNGESLSSLGHGVPDPIGPSGAAAAFDRDAFLAVGGFDENLFAYLEDVDLVLRMRTEGGRCVLAPEARGTHEHSATLGSGSRRKNYLMGFGRGYLLRKWSVLSSPTRLARAAFEDGAICLGQAVMDRNLEGIRGRWHGLRAATPAGGFPNAALGGTMASGMLSERLRRRRRLRRQARRG